MPGIINLNKNNLSCVHYVHERLYHIAPPTNFARVHVQLPQMRKKNGCNAKVGLENNGILARNTSRAESVNFAVPVFMRLLFSSGVEVGDFVPTSVGSNI